MDEHAGIFRRLSEDQLVGGTISVVTARVETPDGTVVDRLLVRHPGAVVVVPVRNGRALLVRQYRAALDGLLLELPAGKRDVSGEPPEVTARRELLEEVGVEAANLALLARFYNSPGFSDELSFCYLATDLSDAQALPQGPEEEHMEIVEVELAEVGALIETGEIIDAKTIIGLLMATAVLGVALGEGLENARN